MIRSAGHRGNKKEPLRADGRAAVLFGILTAMEGEPEKNLQNRTSDMLSMADLQMSKRQ